MNVNFKANRVLQTTIKEMVENKSPANKKVTFIEFDPFVADDINCLFNTAVDWRESKFALSVYQDAYMDGNWSEKDEIVKKYYALTEQMSNFKQPKHNKILGLIETEQISKTLEFIHYLQVNPAFMWETLKSKYKHIGSSILDAIKKLYPTKKILLEPEDGTEPFYIKNGFEKLEDSSKMMFKNCTKLTKKL